MTADDDVTAADRPLEVLAASVGRLARLVGDLTTDDLRRSAYPTEWTIADVLSHLGSGAVIMRHRLEETLAGRAVDDSFNTATWDAWNAKSPEDQAADMLVTDRALVNALVAVGPDERAGYSQPFGPLTIGFAELVKLRLNEHTLHSWDVAVTLDPQARLAADATGLVVDALGRIAGFAGEPAAEARTLQVRTTDPVRHLVLELGTERVKLTALDGAASGDADADLELPAEAFVRLVYGRLDPGHTPAGLDSPHLDELRRTFPGF